MESRLRLLFTLFVILTTSTIQCSQHPDETRETIEKLAEKGLLAEQISARSFVEGEAPEDFAARTGAPYKPSYNEDPAISPQCWIETSYGKQNACQYCHTDYLASIGHGNALRIAEDQILYSFPTANLNKVLWQNIIYPENIQQRLTAEGIAFPEIDDVDYVRRDNWTPAFAQARGKGNRDWMNRDDPDDAFALFPALDPNHLFPGRGDDPTGNGTHGYIDAQGFVRDEQGGYTGWRAINFFPYGIFTPLTGSVSGVYLRLPRPFMTLDGGLDMAIYASNLELLERTIKNQPFSQTAYYGDAANISVHKGFYPVGTEFAHPLHYVDLQADGEEGERLDGVVDHRGMTYEFPGTRAKRVKEIRYMYKWQEVGIDELADDHDGHSEFEGFLGREGQGWVDNDAGWILAGFIEDRAGQLRPQTTEELVQCIGCHGNVGNTVDAVWSFQRKLPGASGWREMDYGEYDARRQEYTRLNDYVHEESGMGELGYFYYTVVGADLYGVMPGEVESEIRDYAMRENLAAELNLDHSLDEISDDAALRFLGKGERQSRLQERQAIMRHYAASGEYLYFDAQADEYYIKGSIFYPSVETMHRNIQMYRSIVLDQSYNLGKDVFGAEPEHVPFTFRSDGTVFDMDGAIIPVGAVITSRPFDEDGEGFTPTGIVGVDQYGTPIDVEGNPVDVEFEPERAVGHRSTGGTFDMFYNPILSDTPFRKEGGRQR